MIFDKAAGEGLQENEVMLLATRGKGILIKQWQKVQQHLLPSVTKR